jgi:hypothetical protein
MKSKRVPCLLAGALEDREERFHNMPRERIGKGVIIKRVKDVSGDSRAVKWHRHMGGAGAKKLSFDGRVV